MFFILPLRANAPRPDVPFVTLALIGLNCFIFLIELAGPGGPQGAIDLWGLQPARMWAGEAVPGTFIPAWVTLLTSTYLHFDLLHLLGNMLMLWLFGCALEYLCGPWTFLGFYTCCGLMSSVMSALLGFSSPLAAAGASGAIAGVMGAFLLNFPRARITCWMLVWFFYPFAVGLRNISAVWFLGGWLLQQLFYTGVALTVLEPGPFGVYAHAAGAVTGMGLIFLLRRPERVLPADHPLRRGRLSAPFIGDAGDAGDGRAPQLSPQERRALEPARLMHLPFDEAPVRALLAQGDLLGARSFCEHMLEDSYRHGNVYRIQGYETLLREIATREASRV
jgi:membrane associated rhomboid family serine protease